MTQHKLLPEDALIRRFAVERRRADEEAALQTWREIVVRNFDRITIAVAAFKFPGGQRLPDTERGAAVSRAYEYVSNLAFAGSSAGELRAAIEQRVWNACMDHGRAELRHEKHIIGSLDEKSFEEEGDRSRFESQIADASRERETQAAELREDAEREDSYTRWVHDSIALVTHADHREVLVLTYVERLAAAAIAERLQISLDNVYQRRRRGTVELERIIRERTA